jgi:allophanate hydrolase
MTTTHDHATTDGRALAPDGPDGPEGAAADRAAGHPDGREAGPAAARVAAAYARLREVDRPEVWITVVDEAAALAAAREVDRRAAAGEDLPLHGTALAVKDNIDVRGLPTTAACPSFASVPGASATAVQRLVDAGCVVIGKTNLDQFATGLVGTRSPYGAVRHASLPDRVSGGSSSGSAVAVALGIVDVALGTDTAGSGRVPAALHGIVGIKSTIGLVPVTGVVPACRSYDVVTTFTRDVRLGVTATAVMAGPDGTDPTVRTWPVDARAALRERPVVGLPTSEGLAALQPAWRGAFESVRGRLAAIGAEVVEVDIRPMLDAARLLYDGAIVAERFAAVGAHIEAGGPGLDPTVAAIILGGKDIPAARYVQDRETLERARVATLAAMAGVDLLVLPTTTEHPTLAAVTAEPVEINRRMGTFTNFVNLLDLAAVAVPAGEADGGPFGISVISRAFDDASALDLAERFVGAGEVGLADGGRGDGGPRFGPPVRRLAVFGAHLRGQPLNGQLQDLGARYVGPTRTSDAYRLVALPTTPPKPGLVRVEPGEGAPVEGEVWEVADGALGRFLADLPAPMTLGQVELEDGGSVVGFGCSHRAAEQGVDITHLRSWRAYLEVSASGKEVLALD